MDPKQTIAGMQNGADITDLYQEPFPKFEGGDQLKEESPYVNFVPSGTSPRTQILSVNSSGSPAAKHQTSTPYMASYGLDSVIHEVASEDENTTYERINTSSSFSGAAMHNQTISPDKVFNILKKDSSMRTNQDLNYVNEFFQRNNQFFQNLLKEKGMYDVFRIYKCITVQNYLYGQTICNYGEHGTQFFIVVKGEVGVKVPTDARYSCRNYFDILQLLKVDYPFITKLKDNHSKVVKKLIDIVTPDLIGTLQLRSLGELCEFIEAYKQEMIRKEEVERLDESYDSSKVPQDQKDLYQQSLVFIGEFLTQIKIQNETQRQLQFHIHYQCLKEVAVLRSGASFGELALITDKPRQATVYSKMQNVALGIVKRKDYLDIIGDSFKLKLDKAIEVIAKYEVFKKLSQRRLRSLYYYVEEKLITRGKFIYQQGDFVDGVYLMVSGEVRKLKKDSTKPGGKVTLSLISAGEALGLDEILLGTDKRTYSVQVTSDRAFLMYFNKKDFKDRVLTPYPEFHKNLRQMQKQRQLLYDQQINNLNDYQNMQEQESLKAIDLLKISNQQRTIPTNKVGPVSEPDKMTKILVEEQRQKMIYQRVGFPSDHLGMILKSINNDKLEILQTQKPSKQRQPSQSKAKQASGGQSFYESFLQKSVSGSLAISITPTTDNQIQSPSIMYKQASSLSARGKQNEQIILRQFSHQSGNPSEASEKVTSIDLATRAMARELEEKVEDMKHAREQGKVLKYLKRAREHSSKSKREKLNSLIQKMEDDDMSIVEDRLISFEDKDRKRVLQKIRDQARQSSHSPLNRIPVVDQENALHPQRKSMVIQNMFKQFRKSQNERSPILVTEAPMVESVDREALREKAEAQWRKKNSAQDKFMEKLKAKSRNTNGAPSYITTPIGKGISLFNPSTFPTTPASNSEIKPKRPSSKGKSLRQSEAKERKVNASDIKLHPLPMPIEESKKGSLFEKYLEGQKKIQVPPVGKTLVKIPSAQLLPQFTPVMTTQRSTPKVIPKLNFKQQVNSLLSPQNHDLEHRNGGARTTRSYDMFADQDGESMNIRSHSKFGSLISFRQDFKDGSTNTALDNILSHRKIGELIPLSQHLPQKRPSVKKPKANDSIRRRSLLQIDSVKKELSQL